MGAGPGAALSLVAGQGPGLPPRAFARAARGPGAPAAGSATRGGCCASSLPAGPEARSPCRDRVRPTFEEALAGGDAAAPRSPGGPAGNRRGARRRQLAADAERDGLLLGTSVEAPTGVGGRQGKHLFLPRLCVSPAPGVKRPRLEAVKRLNFGQDEMEEPPLPDSPPRDITPPPSPEVPAELWGEGCVAWGSESLGIGRVSCFRPGPKAWAVGLWAGGQQSGSLAPGLRVTGSKMQDSLVLSQDCGPRC